MERKQFLMTVIGVGAGAAVSGHPLVELLAGPTERTVVPSAIGRHEIDEVLKATQVFHSWSNTSGGGPVREAVFAQLRYSAELLNAHCPEHLRPELYSAVCRLAGTAGFTAFDAYAHDDARRIFRFAIACAEPAGNWGMRAVALSDVARQAFLLGDHDSSLTAIESALIRADRLTPIERAMLHSFRARVLATIGRTQDALAAIARADDEFSNANSAGVSDPWHMDWYDTAEHDGEIGHALAALAMHGRSGSAAHSRLTTATTGFGDTYARSRMLCQIRLASLAMAVGDPREAAVIGTEAMAAGAIPSRRVAGDLRELGRIAGTYAGVPEVAELRHRIDRVVAGV